MDLLDQLLGLTLFASLALVFLPLERWRPFHEQPVLRRNWQHDLAFWLLNRPLILAGGGVGLAGALMLNRHVVPATLSHGLGGLPLWASVPLAIGVSDLVFYAVHRAAHTFPVLWQFHAVHHGIRELDWLAGVRVHPIDQIATSISGVCAQVALGFSPETLVVTGAIYLWQSALLHSNVRVPLGPLAWIVAGPVFHHWHHSTDPAARDRNFAGQIALLDWVFGTAYYPADRLPLEYGVDDPVPDAYFESLAYPLRRLASRAHRAAAGPLPRDASRPREA